MNPTQAHYRESLPEVIETEIESSEESIQLMKRRQNALQPISSFPPEILAAIFSFLCLPGIPSLGGDRDQNRAQFRLSHVCHRWREIVLNQPQLWSHINFNTLTLAGTTEILDRAKSVPLYMEIRVSGRHDDDRFGLFLKGVQARLPDIHHLSIDAGPFRIYSGLKNALVLPAPTLESLSPFCQRDKNMSTAADRLFISDTLFGGSTPRLSCLKLRNCNVRWNSPLFRGLTYLEIVTPYQGARPALAVWLDTLYDIPQLKTLNLHSAAPLALHYPFDVQCAVTLPSLTHLYISDYLLDCALVLAHLVLPALSSLRLTAIDYLISGSAMQEFLPYVVRHVHGPQDNRPLQSVLIRNRGHYLNLLAWPMPDIDTLVHDPPAFLGATLPTRVQLSWMSKDDDRVEVFGIVMAALPLDGLLTLAAVDLELLQNQRSHSRDLTMQQFWLSLIPNWPLLRRVRLAFITLPGFIKALQDDSKNPLLPSLTELVLVDTPLYTHWTHRLCDVLMKRVEQGVPLETLDLRMCYRNILNLTAVRLLGEIVADLLPPFDFLGPEETEESRGAGLVMLDNIKTLWYPLCPQPPYPFSEGDHHSDANDNDN